MSLANVTPWPDKVIQGGNVPNALDVVRALEDFAFYASVGKKLDFPSLTRHRDFDEHGVSDLTQTIPDPRFLERIEESQKIGQWVGLVRHTLLVDA
jgi:hypothetical protein